LRTSLDDLLRAVDEETSLNSVPLGDAVASLGHASVVLSRLRLLRSYKHADLAGPLDRLQAEATSVAGRWAAAPGRCAELMGAVADVTGRQAYELSDNDSWHVALSVATFAARWGVTIAESSPTYAPGLSAMIEAAHQVRRLGAAHPPMLSLHGGVHRQLATDLPVTDQAPAQVLADSVSGIVGHLQSTGRSTLSVRQAIAVCRTAEVAEASIKRSLDREPTGVGMPCEIPLAWQTVREEVARFSDGNRDPHAGDNQPIWIHVQRAHRAAAQVGEADVLVQPLVETVHRLDQVADLIYRELRQSQASLMVFPGDRPLREGRVGEWLSRTTFLAEEDDFGPLTVAVDDVKAEMSSLAEGQPLQRDGLALRPSLSLV
jgi:hypothetical protein